MSFFDYFWKSTGFSYDPNKNLMFSFYHILLFSLVVLLCVGIMLIAYKKELKTKKNILKIVGVTLLLLELLRIVNFTTVMDRTLLSSVGFHMCSIAVYYTIIACFLQRKWMFDAVFILSFIGAPIALLMPSGILPWWNEWAFMPVQSFISHALIIMVPIYALSYKLWQIKWSNVWISCVSFLISVALAYFMSLVNVWAGQGAETTNFFWTRYADSSLIVLNQIPYPYYLIVMILFMSGVSLLTYFFAGRKIKTQ